MSIAAAMDLATFRGLFPALRSKTWLNTATVAPGSTPVLSALRRVEQEWETGTFSWQQWEAEAHKTREQFARLVGGERDSVALVGSLALATATVAASIARLGRGKVVVGEREFRSNLFAWQDLRSAGLEIVEVPATDGVVGTEALLHAIDRDTVLVAVTEVQSSNGVRVRLPAIAQRCRDVGARLYVNLTQSLGVLDFNLRDVPADFVAAHGYKWLLAPRGAAWLHVRPDRLNEMQPIAPSWKSVSDPYASFYGSANGYATTARKLDLPLAWFPWIGAQAALSIIDHLDRVQVQERALSLAERFRREAGALGFQSAPTEAPSQIVGLVIPDADRVKAELASRKVEAAVRIGFLRLSFHGFNTEDDLARGLDALRQARPA